MQRKTQLHIAMLTAMVSAAAIGHATVRAAAPPFESEKLIPTDVGSRDLFGHDLVVVEDRALIGAQGQSAYRGAVYDYRYDPVTQLWSERAKLVPPGLDPNDFFGSYMAIDTEWAMLTAYGDDTGGESAGAVYVYRFENNEWSFHTKLTSPEPGYEGFFGAGTAVSGEWAFLGSRWKSDYGRRSGALYLYRLIGLDWTFQMKLDPGTLEAGDEFGTPPSMTDEWAVVGATGDDDGGSNAGAVYIYRLVGSEWVLYGKHIASDSSPNDGFGHYSDIEGTTAIVGTYSGEAAYLLEFDGMNWVETHKFTASDGVNGDRFGFHSAIDNGRIAIGSYSHAGRGAVYVYTPDGQGEWFEQKLVASDGAQGDNFGFAVDINRDTAFASSHGDDNQRGYDAGAAYLFEITLPCLQLNVSNVVAGEMARFTITGGTPGAHAVVIWGLQTGERVINNNRFGLCATYGIARIENQNQIIQRLDQTFDAEGRLVFFRRIPTEFRGTRMLLQAAERDTCPDECMSNVMIANVQ